MPHRILPFHSSNLATEQSLMLITVYGKHRNDSVKSLYAEFRIPNSNLEWIVARIDGRLHLKQNIMVHWKMGEFSYRACTKFQNPLSRIL